MGNILRDLFITPGLSQSLSGTVILVVVIIWSFIWKGFALWHAAKNDEKYWFFAVLILNTVGIIEIIYLFFFSKKRWDTSTVQKFVKKYI